MLDLMNQVIMRINEQYRIQEYGDEEEAASEEIAEKLKHQN